MQLLHYWLNVSMPALKKRRKNKEVRQCVGKHTFLMMTSWIIMPCHPRGMSFWGCTSCCSHKFPQGCSTTGWIPSPSQMYEAQIKSESWPTGCLTIITPGGETGSLKERSHKKGVGRNKTRVKVIGRRWTPGQHAAHSFTIYTTAFHNQTNIPIPKHEYTHASRTFKPIIRQQPNEDSCLPLQGDLALRFFKGKL